MTVESNWFWFWFWFCYTLWLASVFTLVLVLRQSSENRSNRVNVPNETFKYFYSNDQIGSCKSHYQIKLYVGAVLYRLTHELLEAVSSYVNLNVV